MATKKDIEPDGNSTSRGVEPDGLAVPKAIDDDVEGHSMMLNPTLGRDLAKAKSADIERGVQSKNNQAEAKRIFRR